jgi:AcrR family transcriptional regulator
MVTHMSIETGRRERKKAATRTALSRAAMRLATEHGVENVTAEAIAAAADVAPRTFHNYFASKEEAIVGELVDGSAGFADALRARPVGEPIWDALRHTIVAVLSESPDGLPDRVAQMHALKASRLLVAQNLTVFEELIRVLAATIAERTGTDIERDAYPRMLAAVAALAVRTAMETWLQSERSANLVELATDALAQLRAGLPEPGVSG